MRPSSIARTVSLLTKKQRPCFIWGPPGVGKSDVIAQVAQQHDMELRDVRLNLLDPVDLKGFPVPDHETKQMSWYPPDFLPPMYVKKGSKMVPNTSKGILFLDELTSAERAVQAASYQLMLNRAIGDYKLPDGWSIVAAGNRSSDRSVVHAMPAALSNRLVHLDYEVNLDDWCQWALKHDIKAEVLAFIRFKSNLLHDFRPQDNPRAFPSPRSWMFVNEIIGEGLPADEELETIKGTVGEGAAAEFYAFLKVIRDMPNPDEILVNPKGAPVPEQPSVLYALTTSLAIRATKDNFDRLMQYNDRLPTEFQVVFVRDSIKRCDDVSKTQAFTKWAIAHSDVLM
jgi:hypothetical protein